MRGNQVIISVSYQQINNFKGRINVATQPKVEKQIDMHFDGSPFTDEPKIIFDGFILPEQCSIHNAHGLIRPSFHIQNFLVILLKRTRQKNKLGNVVVWTKYEF